MVATRRGRLSSTACWAALVTGGARLTLACLVVRSAPGRELGAAPERHATAAEHPEPRPSPFCRATADPALEGWYQDRRVRSRRRNTLQTQRRT
jgi:hypothetical protein